MSPPTALLVAIALDLLVGEPPSSLHPVVAIGRALAWLECRAPTTDRARLAYGAVVAVALPSAVAVLVNAAQRALPWPAQSLLLKPTFSGSTLLKAAERVEQYLVANNVAAARAELRWLVSRPTADLDEALVAAAAIESLAENFVDSWVAPLLAYAASGLGGAYAYRAANTADAMWGYHSPTYECLGKVAARLDDALNVLPARLGAVLLAVASPHPASAFYTWRQEAGKTESPNAGHPMAAMAGALGVRLEKRDHYVLNPVARAPGPADIATARRTVVRAMLLAAALSSLLRWLRR